MTNRSVEPYYAALGTRIRRRRKELGITLTVLGKAIGVTYQQMSKYEVGMNRPPVDKVAHIAIFLHVSLGWLILGEQP